MTKDEQIIILEVSFPIKGLNSPTLFFDIFLLKILAFRNLVGDGKKR